MFLLSMLTALAAAGEVFLNGVRIDPRTLSSIEMEDVDVRFSTTGDVFIDAPQYQVTPQPSPIAPVAPSSATTMSSASLGASARAVPAARWWLATEDSGSTGHTATVLVNGQVVRAIRSGDPQAVVDLQGFLRPGMNTVRVESNSIAAVGGALYIYVGSGSNVNGALSLDEPAVQFGLGAGRTGAQIRDYTLTVR